MANRKPSLEDAAATDGGQPGVAEARRPAAPPGEVNSRDDVLKALDRICAYYTRFEPSSPLPFLLQRCKKMVPMSFADILKEIAPNGVAQFETVVGKPDE
ncbi:MAG: hypothetical protein QM756_11735 [Polyangiaceae bacterium]